MSWSVMSTALNLFLLLVFGVHLIRAVIAHLDLVSSYQIEDRSLTRLTLFCLWKYEEFSQCLNALILVIWTKVTKMVIAWKLYNSIPKNMSRHVERPRSTLLFGLCALHFLVICRISSVCSSFLSGSCNNQNCLNVIGL